jgi:alkaline phosphatase
MFRDGSFIVVDEYSPSVAIIADTGKVLKRYTPAGKTLSGSTYPVSDILPAILTERRANRGFEAVAVTSDEQTAYVIMQSPLGPTRANTPTRNSRLLRILRLDISDPLSAAVTGQFVMLMSPATDYPAGNRPQDLKVSAAVSVNDTQLLLIERTDEPGIGGAKLLLLDLEGATDVNGMAIAQTLALEDSSLDLATLGITPASTQVVYENEETPELQDFKLEGLSIINRNIVALSNDNDFGLAGQVPFQVWVIRLADKLPK